MLGVLNNGSVYDLTTVRLDSCASDSLFFLPRVARWSRPVGLPDPHVLAAQQCAAL